MTESFMQTNGKEVTAYVGPDATNLYRARVLKMAISLYLKTKMKPTRGVGITKMLTMCKEYTGVEYKRTQGEQALIDLNVWIEVMASSLPVVKQAPCKDGAPRSL